MSRRIEWSTGAIDDLFALPRDLAERVDAAVQALAATGHGFVRDVVEDGATERRLYVPGAWVRVAFDPRTLYVRSVNRSALRR